MGQARRVDRSLRGARQRGQHVAVKLNPPVRGDRLLDRQARQLVPELEPVAGGVEHPRAQTLLERRQIVPGHRLEQPQLDPRRAPPPRPRAPATRGGERCAARASTAPRTVSGISTSFAASASVTKNGFPQVRSNSRSPSAPDGAASARTASRESGGCARARPRAPRRARPARSATGRPDQLIVSEGHHRQHRQRLDPARQQLDHVQRPHVGPVHVLDHEHACRVDAPARRPARRAARTAPARGARCPGARRRRRRRCRGTAPAPAG